MLLLFLFCRRGDGSVEVFIVGEGAEFKGVEFSLVGCGYSKVSGYS